MIRYETDEEQVAAIKNWWKENSSSLLITLLIAVLSWTGWNYYQNDKRAKAENASAVFNVMQLSMQQGSFANIAREGMKLIKEQPESPYSSGASLLLAKYNLQQNKADEAIKNLQWVVDNSIDTSLVTVAKLRLAKLLLDLGKIEQAKQTLDAIDDTKLLATDKSNVDYAKASIALKNNQIDQAITLLKKVVGNSKAAGNLKILAQLQLDDLAK